MIGSGKTGRLGLVLAMAALLAGCGSGFGGHGKARNPAPQTTRSAALSAPAPTLSPDQAARNFVDVITRVEPLAEAACQRFAQGQNCDFDIGIDSDPRQPANAYQTLDETGRPQIVFTIALIAEAHNADELAFVLGHEAGHHIAGHLAQTEQEALTGAILGGVLATAAGADASSVRSAQEMGAQVGALRFSQAHELEADRIGTAIAWKAGYDPILGAQFFARLPDPGDGFLNSHPANAERQAAVAQTYARITSR